MPGWITGLRYSQFQSIFWWIMLLKFLFGVSSIGGVLFQSIFWWIMLLKLFGVPLGEKVPLCTFQSIFWWIMLLKPA